VLLFIYALVYENMTPNKPGALLIFALGLDNVGKSQSSYSLDCKDEVLIQRPTNSGQAQFDRLKISNVDHHEPV
jgi:hypothetical protein